MTSQRAWQTALHFFADGNDGNVASAEAAVRAAAVRPADDGNKDVSALHFNDDGLRYYATRGDWVAVADLARKLEEAAGRRVAAATTTSSSDSDAAAVAAAAAIRARLPYVLVQATAHMHMRRVAHAQSVVAALGDLEHDPRYVHPTTGDSIVPFSLRLLAALLPYYAGIATEAQDRLYALLTVCEQHMRTAATARTTTSAADAAATLRQMHAWRQRRQRVLRALACVHTCRLQYALAATLYRRVFDDDDDDVGDNSNDSDDDDSGRATSARMARRLRRVLHLQRLACMHLQHGNAAAAGDMFARIDSSVMYASDVAATAVTHAATHDEHSGVGNEKDSDDACATTVATVAAVYRTVRAMNRALLLVFHGRYAEAALAWHDVVQTTTRALQAHTTHTSRAATRATPAATAAAATTAADATRQQRDGNSRDGSSDDDGGEADLCELLTVTLRQLCAHAQTSHVTCLVYAHADTVGPHDLLPSTVRTMEHYLRDNARALLQSDAFVENAVRLYTLSGDRAPRLRQLAHLIEVCCGDATALSRLEAMV